MRPALQEESPPLTPSPPVLSLQALFEATARGLRRSALDFEGIPALPLGACETNEEAAQLWSYSEAVFLKVGLLSAAPAAVTFGALSTSILPPTLSAAPTPILHSARSVLSSWDVLCAGAGRSRRPCCRTW